MAAPSANKNLKHLDSNRFFPLINKLACGGGGCSSAPGLQGEYDNPTHSQTPRAYIISLFARTASCQSIPVKQNITKQRKPGQSGS